MGYVLVVNINQRRHYQYVRQTAQLDIEFNVMSLIPPQLRKRLSLWIRYNFLLLVNST